jgi:glutamine amidotransferase
LSVAVARLGVGNTASVMFALERLGAAVELTDDPARIAAADRVILPGVGAAAHAMRLIEERGLRGVLTGFKRPLLGICLGQQLLFERSEEGDAEGLGVMSGTVFRLPVSPGGTSPHMGWSRIAARRAHPLIDGLDGAWFYFVHAYACPVSASALAVAEHGAAFAAAVGFRNFYGCQFHPERSGEAGARFLQNFLSLTC